jgi:hypothetical protein
MVMMFFDDLSSDVLLEIINYLSFTELIHTFFGLQKRLDDVIRNYSSCINISKIINQNDLEHLSFKCRSLILSGLDLDLFQIKYYHLNLISLRSVTFMKMNLLTLHSFIEKLPMQQLESITIGRFTWQYYPIDFYKQIWSIIMNSINGNCLRYLHLPYHIRHWNTKNLSYEFSVLRRASLEYTSVTQMLAFMSHTPNLRRFKACLASPHRDLFRYTITLSKLNHLTLNLHDEWSLEEIQQLFTICPYLKHLILKLEVRKERKIIFEPITWQTLIEEKLIYLIFLQLRLYCIIVYPDIKGCNFQENFNHAEYWLQRKPHFQVIINEFQRKIL